MISRALLEFQFVSVFCLSQKDSSASSLDNDERSRSPPPPPRPIHMGQTFSALRCWSVDAAKAADAFDDVASSPLAPGPEVARLGTDLLARVQPS